MTAEQATQIIDLLKCICIGIGVLGGILITQTFWNFLRGAK